MEKIKVLLGADANPFYEDFRETPAIYERFLRMLQSLQYEKELRDCLPISGFFEDYNFSHLHRVVLGARPLELQAELNSGVRSANTNSQDDMKLTSLHWATLKGDLQAIAMLLSAGADVDVRDIEDNTVLINACLGDSKA